MQITRIKTNLFELARNEVRRSQFNYTDFRFTDLGFNLFGLLVCLILFRKNS